MRAAVQALWTVLEQIILALVSQPVAGRQAKPKRAPDFRPAPARRTVQTLVRQVWLALIGQPDAAPRPTDSASAASNSKPRS